MCVWMDGPVISLELTMYSLDGPLQMPVMEGVVGWDMASLFLLK